MNDEPPVSDTCVPALRRRPHGYWKDDANIREALEGLIAGGDTWPTMKAFEHAGLTGLYASLHEARVLEEWAERLGVSRRSNSPWTPDRVEAALTPLIKEVGRWPSRGDFAASDLLALYKWLQRTEGARETWARHFGVSPDTPKPRWTDDRIRDSLGTLIEQVGRWPTLREFKDADLGGLYQALCRTGQMQRWADHFGVTVPVHEWTDEKIDLVIGRLIEEVGRWPTQQEFARAGLSALLRKLRRSETLEIWAERYGVEPPATSHPGAHQNRWTDERIEAVLDPLVDRLGHFPSRQEFGANGLAPLYKKLDAAGRLRWQARLTVINYDGSVDVRPPLDVSYRDGVGALWRFCRSHDHGDVPDGYVDPDTGVELARWLRVTLRRTSAEAVRAQAQIRALAAGDAYAYAQETL